MVLIAAAVVLTSLGPACSRDECVGDLTYALTGETSGCPGCEAETPYEPTLDDDPEERPARVLFADQSRGWLVMDLDSEESPRSLWPLLSDRCEGADLDGDVGISLNAAWLVFQSPADDVDTVEVLNTDTGYVRWTLGLAIDNSGEIVAFGASVDSGDTAQISIVRRGCSDWCAPEVISVGSPWPFNAYPHLTTDGNWVAYSCGPQEYGANEVCVQEVDATAEIHRSTLGEVVYEGDVATILGRPVFNPAGDWIFAADAGDDQRIWRLLDGDGEPFPIRPAYGNDSLPCTLGDGRVVSRWYGDGVLDEGIKVMDIDGDGAWVRDPGVDPSDIVALHCGGG